jgi:formate dehydrogenase major subunit
MSHDPALFRAPERPGDPLAIRASRVGSVPRGHRHAPYSRLTQPLVRDDGALRPASWDEALQRAGSALRAVRDLHGGRALGFFSCSKSTNEMNFIAQKLARAAAGTNNIDSCNRT